MDLPGVIQSAVAQHTEGLSHLCIQDKTAQQKQAIKQIFFHG
jgi:hypothetical protein